MLFEKPLPVTTHDTAPPLNTEKTRDAQMAVFQNKSHASNLTV